MARSLAAAEKEARSIVNKWALGAGAISFLPGATLLLGGADIKMIRDVAASFEVRSYNVEEISAAIAATFAGRVAADGLLSFVPVVGWAVKAGVAASVTKGAGEIVIRYFRDRSALA